MSIEERAEAKCTLNNEELISRCDEWVTSLARTGAKTWSLSIPVNFNRDPDILFSEITTRFKHATEQQALSESRIKELEEALKRAYALIEKL